MFILDPDPDFLPNRIQDPRPQGSKRHLIQGSKRHRILDADPQHCVGYKDSYVFGPVGSHFRHYVHGPYFLLTDKCCVQVLRLVRQLHLHLSSQAAAAAVNPPLLTTPKKGETNSAAAAMDSFLSKKITNKVVTQLQVSFVFQSILSKKKFVVVMELHIGYCILYCRWVQNIHLNAFLLCC